MATRVPRYRERGVRTGRRLPGTGRLLIRRTPDGTETYYGTWYANGRRLKRRIGPRRGRNERAGGLTERQAEDTLRRLIADTEVRAPVTDRMTIVDIGALYIRNAERRGRKKSTLLDIDSDIRVHLKPFFGRRPIDTFDYNDVIDLMAPWNARTSRPRRSATYSPPSQHCSTSPSSRSADSRTPTPAPASRCPPSPTRKKSASSRSKRSTRCSQPCGPACSSTSTARCSWPPS